MTDLMAELRAEMDAIEAKGGIPAPGGNTNSLEALTLGAQRYLEKDQEIANTEARLNALKQEKYKLETQELMELMQGIDTITVGGFVFTPGTTYHASIPKDQRNAAHDWLERDGSGDIITYNVTTQFPRDSEDDVKRLTLLISTMIPDEELVAIEAWLAFMPDDALPNFRRLLRLGAPGFPKAVVSSERSVPWARLTSWYKDRMLNLRVINHMTGETDEPPADVLGAKVEHKVIVKPVRNKQ